MNVAVKTFGILKDHFQSDFVLNLETPVRVLDVVEEMRKKKPATSGILDVSLWAVQDKMVGADRIVEEGEVVLILPPLSGG
ncbi:MoaD/ThiS family protein [Leptospira sp. FAT2]|uniref:MoaD/ThiS family protein n=1 Tax=Leptospira sanjuanensis TaxID=2879643 RepID=UPI001EE8E5EA|nr:MoaD/ThiS family protein [Leptospira sanjuanensis]MCG6166483.1 MoaD/ThiS family protein [Leptospira sanjuanensis]MCG6191874.1 MoaD/ThiS family protein [Leptospira sanjuanensis]